MDGDLDMVLHFKAADTGIDADTTEACISGRYLGLDNKFHLFFGCDAVRIVPPDNSDKGKGK